MTLHLLGTHADAVLSVAPGLDRIVGRHTPAKREKLTALGNPKLPGILDGNDTDRQRPAFMPKRK